MSPGIYPSKLSWRQAEMTKHCKLTLASLVLFFSAFNSACAATPAQPKVVFIGDQVVNEWPLNHRLAMMSQMAASTFATVGCHHQGWYLQNTEMENESSDYKTVANVNTVASGVIVQFTPVGLYTNGVYENITNTNYYGASGTWASSNPLVTYVNEQGPAYAMSGGTANITYTAPNGVKFSLWTMHVGAPSF
jgi:hypothetical protein